MERKSANGARAREVARERCGGSGSADQVIVSSRSKCAGASSGGEKEREVLLKGGSEVVDGVIRRPAALRCCFECSLLLRAAGTPENYPYLHSLIHHMRVLDICHFTSALKVPMIIPAI